MRCTEMQLWPAKEKAFAASFDAASSRSASPWTITGVALPSSSSTFFLRRALAELPADLGGAGERDRAHPLVLDQDVADLARGPDDDVEPTGRQPGLVLELGERQRGERRLARRLEDDGAAGRERGRDLVRDEVEREVERADRADDPDRLAQRERELALAGLGRVHRARPRRRACAPRRRRTCRSTSRGSPRPWRPSAACRPRRRSGAAISSCRRAIPATTLTRISARLCAGSGSAMAFSAASIGGSAPRPRRPSPRGRRPRPSTASAPRASRRSRPTRRRSAASALLRSRPRWEDTPVDVPDVSYAATLRSRRLYAVNSD